MCKLNFIILSWHWSIVIHWPECDFYYQLGSKLLWPEPFRVQVEDLLTLFWELREVHSRGDILASMSGHKFDMADGSLVSATGSLNIWLLRCNKSLFSVDHQTSEFKGGNQSEKTTLYSTYNASLKRNLLGSKKVHKLDPIGWTVRWWSCVICH